MLMQHKTGILSSVIAAIAACIGLALSTTAMAEYKTPGQVPAMMSRLAAVTPLVGVAKAGKRIVAVGLHGHIVYSDDEGKTWTQSPSPVSSDLTAVSFPDEKNGWAVGHEGIVLHTSDGGNSWEKQLDGKAAADLTLKYFQAKTGTERTPDVERAARQAKALVDEINTQTLLDVAFESDKVGYVVGTFNRIFRTEDGGKSWTPLMDKTNNPKELHFYAIQSVGKDTYLAGEQGMVWYVDRAKNTFTPIQTPYNGTLFGLIVDGPNLITFGMRGALLRSADAGKSWERIQLGNQAGISGGVVLPEGQIAIANQAGGIMLSTDKGKSYQAAKVAKPMSYFGIKAIAERKVVVVGSEGVRVETLQ